MMTRTAVGKNGQHENLELFSNKSMRGDFRLRLVEDRLAFPTVLVLPTSAASSPQPSTSHAALLIMNTLTHAQQAVTL